jgi:hypothetical protein
MRSAELRCGWHSSSLPHLRPTTAQCCTFSWVVEAHASSVVSAGNMQRQQEEDSDSSDYEGISPEDLEELRLIRMVVRTVYFF